MNLPPGEAPELNEPFVFTYPDGHKREFENVKVFLDYVINGEPEEKDNEESDNNNHAED